MEEGANKAQGVVLHKQTSYTGQIRSLLLGGNYTLNSCKFQGSLLQETINPKSQWQLRWLKSHPVHLYSQDRVRMQLPRGVNLVKSKTHARHSFHLNTDWLAAACVGFAVKKPRGGFYFKEGDGGCSRVLWESMWLAGGGGHEPERVLSRHSWATVRKASLALSLASDAGMDQRAVTVLVAQGEHDWTGISEEGQRCEWASGARFPLCEADGGIIRVSCAFRGTAMWPRRTGQGSCLPFG